MRGPNYGLLLQAWQRLFSGVLAPSCYLLWPSERFTWCREAINNANDYVCLFLFCHGKRNVLSNCNSFEGCQFLVEFTLIGSVDVT